MASKTYTNFQQPAVDADWLNDVNDFIYGLGETAVTTDQFLRSDASDTFTAQDFFHSNVLPRHFFVEDGVGADQSIWALLANAERFGAFIYSDDLLNSFEYLTIQRSGIGAGITVDSIDLTATNINLNGNVTVDNSTQTTVGAAGAASALPANPTGYLILDISGTEYVLPYYAKA